MTFLNEGMHRRLIGISNLWYLW